MIREIIRPTNNNFTIVIPNEYINQEVEFIMFPLGSNEISNKKQAKKLQKSLKGVFSIYADNSKIDLESKAWQNHIVEKYTI
jgi:hypothetical protein